MISSPNRSLGQTTRSPVAAVGAVGTSCKSVRAVVATVDLVLALLVGLTFVVRDARARRVDARPFVALTLGTGSLGLLTYLWQHDDAEA